MSRAFAPSQRQTSRFKHLEHDHITTSNPKHASIVATPTRFSGSGFGSNFSFSPFIAAASSRSSSPTMDENQQQPRRSRRRRQGFSPSYKPSFHKDLAQTDINAAICEMQSRDGSVSWKVIADYINAELGRGGVVKNENSFKEEEMEDAAISETKERLRGPIIPGSCNDRWHRHRIVYQVLKGRDVPYEWLEPWIDQDAASLPLDPAKSFYCQKVTSHINKSEDIPAALVDECTDWLEQCVKNVMRARKDGEEVAGKEKKRIKMLEKEVKQLKGEVKGLRDLVEEMGNKMSKMEGRKKVLEDKKMIDVVEID